MNVARLVPGLLVAVALTGLLRVEAQGQGVLYTFPGEEGDRHGFSVSGAGDVNGDGCADVVVGAPRDGFGATAGDEVIEVFRAGKSGEFRSRRYCIGEWDALPLAD